MTPATPVAAIRQLANDCQLSFTDDFDRHAIINALLEYAAFREAQETAPDPVEAFYAAVNARAEADVLMGKTITGAHHRALEHEICRYRESTPMPCRNYVTGCPDG